MIETVRGTTPGDLVTYGDLAAEIGRPGAGQAVANVLRRAPDLPWWRVVPAEGRLYRTHTPTQAPLLEAEGHRVDAERRVEPAPVGPASVGRPAGVQHRHDQAGACRLGPGT